MHRSCAVANVCTTSLRSAATMPGKRCSIQLAHVGYKPWKVSENGISPWGYIKLARACSGRTIAVTGQRTHGMAPPSKSMPDRKKWNADYAGDDHCEMAHATAERADLCHSLSDSTHSQRNGMVSRR